jgi:hypothetical protein
MTVLAVDTQNSLYSATPGSTDGTLVGRNATTPVGFFGATPVARPGPISISAGTVAQVVTALGALGLISTSA